MMRRLDRLAAHIEALDAVLFAHPNAARTYARACVRLVRRWIRRRRRVEGRHRPARGRVPARVVVEHSRVILGNAAAVTVELPKVGAPTWREPAPVRAPLCPPMYPTYQQPYSSYAKLATVHGRPRRPLDETLVLSPWGTPATPDRWTLPTRELVISR